MMMPPFAVSFSSSLRTRTRSCRGVIFTVISLTSVQSIPKAQDGGSYFTGQVEKVPIRALDVSGQRRAIRILDDSPARQEGFTFDRQVRGQRCCFPNQNGPCSVSVWHLSFPYLRDV